jgi:hypothetical protein
MALRDRDYNYTAGSFRREKAGTDFEYEYFLPSMLPEKLVFEDPNIQMLLEEATQKLGERAKETDAFDGIVASRSVCGRLDL